MRPAEPKSARVTRDALNQLFLKVGDSFVSLDRIQSGYAKTADPMIAESIANLAAATQRAALADIGGVPLLPEGASLQQGLPSADATLASLAAVGVRPIEPPQPAGTAEPGANGGDAGPTPSLWDLGLGKALLIPAAGIAMLVAAFLIWPRNRS